MNHTEPHLQQPQTQTQTPQPYYYQTPPASDEIDLFELFTALLAQWKLIVAITAIGALLSIAVALNKPKVYESSATVRVPSAAQIAAINENGYSIYSIQQIFKNYFDQVKSEENLKNYITNSKLLSKLLPDIEPEKIQQAITGFTKQLDVTILEPTAPKGETVLNPSLFQISFATTQESVAVELINNYLRYIEEIILKDIRDESFVHIQLKANNIKRDIDLLRMAAKTSREYLITRLSSQNREKIEAIKQKIALLRADAKSNRLLLIERMKEANAAKIASLKQEIDLLKDMKRKEIISQSTNLQEAYKLAQKMGINKPTTIDVLASSSTPPRTTPQTQVNVSNSTNSMTFLLGTEYLSSQIDILNSRADITQFILKIPELESQIKSAQNDTKILELQNRVSDDPYIDGLQQLFSQITALENDTKLTELKNRESDDPFIEILPQKLNELEILNHITFDFGEASIFQIDRAAAVDGIAEKPNRKLIIVLGTLLSGMLAMFIALIVSAANKRALRQES